MKTKICTFKTVAALRLQSLADFNLRGFYFFQKLILITTLS